MTTKLPPAWQEIVNEFGIGEGSGHAVLAAVERCYALANKPKKELTDAELVEAYAKGAGLLPHVLHVPERVAALRAVVAAHESKQQEPEKVKFRAARLKSDPSRVEVFRADVALGAWEWLEPEQSFEVVLPC